MQRGRGPERQLWHVWHEGALDYANSLSTLGRESVLRASHNWLNTLPERKHWKSCPAPTASSDCSNWSIFWLQWSCTQLRAGSALLNSPRSHHQCEAVGLHWRLEEDSLGELHSPYPWQHELDHGNLWPQVIQIYRRSYKIICCNKGR